LGELVENLYGLREIEPVTVDLAAMRALPPPENIVDFADIKGQEHIKRALEIAVAGNHNVRMVGAPGVGKSLLARALPGILPSLTTEEALEVTRIYSVADALDGSRPLIQHRPFQNPHHTISQAGLIGGGTIPKPGAVSLSHRGVLFLDEINEFGRGTLEVMRQPIEDKQVTISRARGTVTYPSNFLLVAAHNPCPCGFYGDTTRECTCTPSMIQRYETRLSGPLLDRIDIHIRVPRVEYDKLLGAERAEPSTAVRARVETARERQLARFTDHAGMFANGDMGAGEVQQLCVLTAEAEQVVGLATRQMRLSARAYHRVLKLARTIADLADSEKIEVPHIAEALGYRAGAETQ
jgi:magnesium chelatase family protein